MERRKVDWFDCLGYWIGWVTVGLIIISVIGTIVNSL